MHPIKNGVFPTMITPYDSRGEIDYGAVRAIVEFYHKNGCAGIFAVCQSSEMFYLSLSERMKLARTVADAARGRLQVVASGHVSGAPGDQAEELCAMADTGVDAVVLVSNRLATSIEDDGAWIKNAQALLHVLPEDIALGIYECPMPYKRLMSKETLDWCAATGRFAFVKDTCCDADLIRQRVSWLEGTGVKLYNANSATLLSCLKDGAAGFSGVMANMHPDLYVWLCNHYLSQPEKAEKLQAMLSFMSYIEADYPICAKEHMALTGIPMTLRSRSMDPAGYTKNSQNMTQQLLLMEEAARVLIHS